LIGVLIPINGKARYLPLSAEAGTGDWYSL